MKIVHICLSGVVTDGFNYQDNLLSKYHRKEGHEVSLITSKWIWNTKGNLTKTDNTYYFNNDGVLMIRLELLGKDNINKKFKKFKNFYSTLSKENPDVLFVHGVAFIDIITIAKYLKRHKNVTVFADNHSDFSNSATNWISKNILHKIVWRHTAHIINPYVKKFYGVLPARVDFLIDVYKVPKNKTELLVMGADDDLVEKAENPINKNRTRKLLGINEDDFLIVTGGKIDNWKKQTLLLMDAINHLKDINLKLVVFGSIAPNLEEEVSKRCSKYVKYVGWANSDESYNYFASSNLVCFPGRHSVYWEQVAGQGVPMICKYWEGTTHVDCGGNVLFLYKDDVMELCEAILKAKDNIDLMKQKAIACSKMFLYGDIAKKAIDFKKMI